MKPTAMALLALSAASSACGVPANGDGGRPQDAARLNDASVYEASCAPPNEPRPEQSLLSCSGPNGAPLEHCREVWGCGGVYNVGAVGAYNGVNGGFWRPMTDRCDIGPMRARPGFIDAYEVSVARFRAWVRAGRPPGAGPRFIPPRAELPFNIDGPLEVYREGTNPAPQPEFCTYRDEPGPNDNLPINCVEIDSAAAFCLWEGKHLVTEAMWEWFATNGGRTKLPFSDVRANDADECEFGDVRRYTGCPREGHLPAPIDAFPLGQTTNPPGVFNLWGGVFELVWSSRSTQDVDSCLYRPPPPDENGRPDLVIRGRAFIEYESHQGKENYGTAINYSATRFAAYSHARDVGFRCARWVPETTLWPR